MGLSWTGYSASLDVDCTCLLLLGGYFSYWAWATGLDMTLTELLLGYQATGLGRLTVQGGWMSVGRACASTTLDLRIRNESKLFRIDQSMLSLISLIDACESTTARYCLRVSSTPVSPATAAVSLRSLARVRKLSPFAMSTPLLLCCTVLQIYVYTT